METGLLWTLSFLGAALPDEGAHPLSWRDNLLTLRLDRAGIDASSLPSWKRLLAAMKASEEYRATGGLDIGRFVALTLCSPNHYYALTGADARFEQAYARHSFAREQSAIVESAVSHGDRLIEVAAGPTTADIAFMAHEGPGSISAGTFVIEEHELLDVMANGQLRFALYGVDGALKPAASKTLTAAGKPAKCLWCHEIALQRPFDGRTGVPGYASLAEFERLIAQRMDALRSARSELDSRVDFARRQDHTYAELLYVSFYEPSVERLAREWDIPVAQVRETLSSLPTHAHHEFDFLGEQLYRRSDVDARAPYSTLEPPTDPREPSAYEPDLLR
ncbi:MAG TPA: hypothetical protein VLI71_18045 [Gammaproteobacteria bacterium]|nr:hypothetical protein [Gammaproteobacteria bacterium]